MRISDWSSDVCSSDLKTREAARRLTTGKTYGHFIGGEWVGSNSGETITLKNPATGADLAYIQSGNAIDVNRAVEAAARAFPIWARSPAVQRQMVLRAIAQRIRERLFDYAMLETLNHGKPITDAVHNDIPGALGMFEYFAGHTFHSYGNRSEEHTSELQSLMRISYAVFCLQKKKTTNT